MELAVGCKLRYTLEKATGFALQVEVAKSEGQMVSDEALVIPGGESNSTYSVFTNPLTRNRVVRTVIGPGPAEIHYEARVNLELQTCRPIVGARIRFPRTSDGESRIPGSKPVLRVRYVYELCVPDVRWDAAWP